MPAGSVRDALARQWEILKTLPSGRPGISTRELTERMQALGFSVQIRQIERDIKLLSVQFPIECNDAGKPYGWHWMRQAGLNLPGLNLAEAVSLRLVESSLRQLLPGSLFSALQPQFNQAREQLRALAANNPQARWADKLRSVTPALPLHPAQVDAEVLEAIELAVVEEKQIEAQYAAAGGEAAKTIHLHPLGIAHRGPSLYLIATAWNYQNPWLFALHRFQSVTTLKAQARVPDGFDLDAYLAEGHLHFGTGKSIRLQAEVSEELAKRLAETPLSDDMRITRSGDRHRVTAIVLDSWQLDWWILSQGPGIRVLKPKALMIRIGDALRAAAAQYE